MKENNKKSKSFNLVDLLIIVLIIAIAGAAYFILNEKIVNTAPDTKYNITLEIRQMDITVAEQIQKDKEIYDRVENKHLGTLIDFRKAPSVSYNISADKGKNVTCNYPNKYDVELDMQIATNDDIYVGKFLSVETKDFMGAGYIIKVEKTEG